MYLICDLTLEDHVTKGSCDFTKGRSTLYEATPRSLVVIGIVIAEIYFQFVT